MDTCNNLYTFKLFENEDFRIIVKSDSDKSTKELFYELRRIADHLIKINKYDCDSELKQENNSEQENNPESEQEQHGLFKCKFCGKQLNYYYDENEMYHCQVCHNIYDGFAQCTH